MHIRPFTPTDTDPVIELWHAVGLTRPWNDPRRDIRRKLEVQPELFLVAERDGRLVGTAMGGYEGHRGWINYLAVDPIEQGSGVGRALVERLEQKLEALGCPKVNLQVRRDNTAAVRFYEHLGYGLDESVSMGKRLIPDA
jgi:ribosomal protein S18 acetylase RimI-like enzyme